MNGLHLIADLHDCRCPAQRLLDVSWLESYCVDACQQHGLTVVGQLFHPFTDAQGAAAGVTGTVVLAESHLAIHTWPEVSGVTLDVYVCNFSGDNSCRAQALFDEMIATFDPTQLEKQSVARGQVQPTAP
jgi:S-adenosylmethionine decarboxylase proenzyme